MTLLSALENILSKWRSEIKGAVLGAWVFGNPNIRFDVRYVVGSTCAETRAMHGGDRVDDLVKKLD